MTGSYVVLGILAALVVMATVYALASRQVSDRRAELARVSQEATDVRAEADRLAPFAQFASLRAKRIATVSSLAQSRFDWAHAIHEVGRVLPRDVWLTSLVGTVSPTVPLEGAGGGGGSGSLRSAVATPAIELVGCTTSQREVARVMTRLRLIDGVTRVSLSASEKADSSGGASGGSGGASSGDCRQGNSRFPQFSVVAFFEAATGAGSGTPGAIPAAGSTPTTPSTKPPAQGAAPTSKDTP